MAREIRVDETCGSRVTVAQSTSDAQDKGSSPFFRSFPRVPLTVGQPVRRAIEVGSDWNVKQLIERLRPYEKVLLDTYLNPQPRDKLLSFTLSTFPTYFPDPAHALIAETLEEVLNGKIKRLMVFAPPQHGKSELISIRFPALWLGKRPDDPIILASYGASLALDVSKSARAVVESPEYQALFPLIRTDPSSRAVDRWRIAKYVEKRGWIRSQGSLTAAGVGGPITGYGAALGIIDDPLKSWEEAQSPTIRKAVWDWFRGTFRTRIWEDGTIILFMTRWHEDDLAGRLLKQQARKWKVLRLPALAESQKVRDQRNKRLGLKKGLPDPLGRLIGEPLCPHRFRVETLEEIREDSGSLVWAAEYDGFPTAAEGNRFKRDWFKILLTMPDGCELVRYWDKAGTEGAGDWTVGTLLGKKSSKVNGRAYAKYFVSDVIRGQWSPFERDRKMKSTAELDTLTHEGVVQIYVEQEPGSGGKESAEWSIQLLQGFPVFKDRVTGSKAVRGEAFAAQCEAGNVFLVAGPWNEAWLDEICGFPNAAHDDQYDSVVGGFNKLHKKKPVRAYYGLV